MPFWFAIPPFCVLAYEAFEPKPWEHFRLGRVLTHDVVAELSGGAGRHMVEILGLKCWQGPLIWTSPGVWSKDSVECTSYGCPNPIGCNRIPRNARGYNLGQESGAVVVHATIGAGG